MQLTIPNSALVYFQKRPLSALAFQALKPYFLYSLIIIYTHTNINFVFKDIYYIFIDLGSIYKESHRLSHLLFFAILLIF